jgi:hypothetical protein
VSTLRGLDNLGLIPDNVMGALRRLGVRELVGVQLKGWKFQRAAHFNEDTRICEAVHVTDDPSRVYAKLRAGKDLDANASERELGQELGPGLYVSDAPDFWIGRSTNKWSFLTQLSTKQRQAFVRAATADVIEKGRRRYVSPSELEHAIRDAKLAFRDGRVLEAFVMRVAGQPYNVTDLWHAEFLNPLGIKAASEPQRIDVEFVGRFAWMEHDFQTPRTYSILRKLGLDGAFETMSMGTSAQTVIWRRNAVRRFGDWHR